MGCGRSGNGWGRSGNGVWKWEWGVAGSAVWKVWEWGVKGLGMGCGGVNEADLLRIA